MVELAREEIKDKENGHFEGEEEGRTGGCYGSSNYFSSSWPS